MNPHKPTKRKLFLMGYAEKGLIHGNVYERSDRKVYSMSIIRGHEFYRPGSECNPSHREIVHLLTFDICELRDDPHHSITDTRTGQVTAKGVRLYLTTLGKRLLKEAQER